MTLIEPKIYANNLSANTTLSAPKETELPEPKPPVPSWFTNQLIKYLLPLLKE